MSVPSYAEGRTRFNQCSAPSSRRRRRSSAPHLICSTRTDTKKEHPARGCSLVRAFITDLNGFCDMLQSSYRKGVSLVNYSSTNWNLSAKCRFVFCGKTNTLRVFKNIRIILFFSERISKRSTIRHQVAVVELHHHCAQRAYFHASSKLLDIYISDVFYPYDKAIIHHTQNPTGFASCFHLFGALRTSAAEERNA